jgi:hypothetical protein
MRVQYAIRERQNEVFSEQLHHAGLLAAAFHAKHGGVQMRAADTADGCIHYPAPAPRVAPVEPHVWKQRADEYRRVCDIPPDECVVVTRYREDGGGSVGFQRVTLLGQGDTGAT